MNFSGNDQGFESFLVSTPLSSLCDSNSIVLNSDIYRKFLIPIDKFICLKGLNDFEKRTDVTENFYTFKGFLRYILYINSNYTDRFNNVQELKKEEFEDFWSELVPFQNTGTSLDKTEKVNSYSILGESAAQENSNLTTVLEKQVHSTFSENRGKVMKQL